jgi:hypothetical protein
MSGTMVANKSRHRGAELWRRWREVEIDAAVSPAAAGE